MHMQPFILPTITVNVSYLTTTTTIMPPIKLIQYKFPTPPQKKEQMCASTMIVPSDNMCIFISPHKNMSSFSIMQYILSYNIKYLPLFSSIVFLVKVKKNTLAHLQKHTCMHVPSLYQSLTSTSPSSSTSTTIMPPIKLICHSISHTHTTHGSIPHITPSISSPPISHAK